MRILVVEDHPKAAGFIAKGLREHTYAVDVVETGAEALDRVVVNSYDLVVLDLMLPDIDGYEVCRTIRQLGLHMGMLMVTAKDAVEDRVRGLDLGADDYLVKPFAFTEFVARVRALLRRGPALHPDVVQIGDLTIDIGARRVTRQSTVIELTTREFALLAFLARNAGRVVGREEISESVWDENYDVASNLIEVYVQRLRRKLDTDASRSLIRTRRGAGYVLDPGEVS
jgi:DNA-binding response OmpR family regulator